MVREESSTGPLVPRTRKEEIYREYMSFFEKAERQRRWNLESDIPWSELDKSLNTEEDAVCLESFCGVELYVPDYTAAGFMVNRSIMGHAWFQACWGYEESKHALVFREYLTRSGLRTTEQYCAFEDQILSKTWKLPYATRRQMICYGALQEAATYHIYRSQKLRHRNLGNRVLEQVLFFVARDEAAHAGFYRSMLNLEFESDRDGALRDLAHVVFSFDMPGSGLLPNYKDRVTVSGVGLSGSELLLRAVYPLLKFVGVTRRDLFRVKNAQLPQTVDPEFLAQTVAHEHSRRQILEPAAPSS